MSDDVVDEETDAGADDGTDDTALAHETRHGAIVTHFRGDTVLHASVEGYLEVASGLRDEGFDQLTDLTAVDYLTYAAPRSLPEGVTAERFEVVFAVLSYTTRERVRIRVQVPADAPVVPTLFDLWPGSEALEREVFDMFGITFEDHPDMSRILMPEDWIGHPLRKDYAIGAIPVQFKAASNIR